MSSGFYLNLKIILIIKESFIKEKEPGLYVQVLVSPLLA